MGQSTPTTTMAIDTFETRYGQFRSELHPREQEWFDELVCRARRHSNAINRRPHLDFERPVMLAMMLEGMRELDGARRDNAKLAKEVAQLRRSLEIAGLMERRIQLDPMRLGRLGQTVLVEA
jgi:hypothetical protein